MTFPEQGKGLSGGLVASSPMDPPRRKAVLLPLIIAAVIYFGGAVSRVALLDDADSVHAEAAREILVRNDWITLHVDGVRYLEKAPLMYWAMALSYRLFGVSEFAARLPIAVAAVLLIWVTIQFGEWAFGLRSGLFAGLILGSSPGLFLFTRITLPDVILTLWITCALYCFARSREEIGSEQRWILGAYLFSALGVLTKGLIGVIFPAAIIGICILVNRDWAALKRAKWLWGTVLFLIVAAPWHLMAGTRTPTFFWFYFVNEHFLRYVGRRHPVDYDTVPRALFWSLHLVWFFPWFVFLPGAVTFLKSSWRRQDRESKVMRLCLVWVAVVLLFFSFSTTQEYYSMPIYPVLALLMGWGIVRGEQLSRKWNRRALILGGALMMLASLAAGVVIYSTRNQSSAGDIASHLTRNPEYYALSLGHFMDLTLPAFAALRYHLIGTCAVFGAGALMTWIFAAKGRILPAMLAISLALAGFFHFAERAREVFSPYLSSKSFADYLTVRHRPGDRVVINGEYESGSSINFYTRRPVYILNGRSANLEYGSYFPDAPPLFLNDDDLIRWWQGGDRVYLVTPNEGRGRWLNLLSPAVYPVLESGGKTLLSNYPEEGGPRTGASLEEPESGSP